MTDKTITLKGEIAEVLGTMAQEQGRPVEAILKELLTARGWTVNYFQTLDAIQADDMLERPEQPPLEDRDQLE